MSNKRKLFIVDGHAQIFAAYFAPQMQALSSPTGEPTKATHIFTTMLLKIIREQQPDLLVVALDSPGPTFRHEIFDAYKANRPPMPDDLRVQIQRIDQILEAMNIATCRVDGYEADDIIATLTREAMQQELEVYICSRDKDLEQLLTPGVALFNPKNGEFLDEQGLLEKKGVTPAQALDVQALTGDTTDNIPGVPDVGPKTAQQWIVKYGTLENLLTHADEIKGKRGQSLRNSADILERSRQLVTLRDDAPVESDLEQFTVRPVDAQKLGPIFAELGFQRLLEQVGIATDQLPANTLHQAVGGGVADFTGLKLQLIDTMEKLSALVQDLSQQPAFAVDTETTGLNPVEAEIVGLSLCWQAGEAYYLPFRAPLGQAHLELDDVRPILSSIFADPRILKCGQNIKYDLVVLEQAGMPLGGVCFDTMLASFLQDPSRSQHGMDALARDHLGYETIKLSELIGKGKNQITFDLVDLQQATDYAAEDAEVTWRLYLLFRDRFTDRELRELFEKVEMPLVHVLAAMESSGVTLDVAALKSLSQQIGDRAEGLVQEIHQAAGRPFNVDSPRQLATVLFEELGLAPIKKGKTGPSTDHEVLEALSWQHAVPKLMLEYRQLSKLQNTYVDKLPRMICARTGRLHTSFHQAVAATGRLSSSDPNLQNIPIRTELGREVRRAFVAPDDNSVLLAADYSQIELRMLAHYSKDTALREAFAAGLDIHRFVAARVNDLDPEQVTDDQRRAAKAVNFGIIYGQTPFGLSRAIGIDVAQAKQFIDAYFARYPHVRRFIDDTIAQAGKDGYVRTILGRRRDLPEIHSNSAPQRQLGQRMAVNTVIQGSAADLIKVAMINLHRRIMEGPLELKMLLQVHDELVFELPAGRVDDYAELIRTEMTEAIALDVPVAVDMGWGPNWLACK